MQSARGKVQAPIQRIYRHTQSKSTFKEKFFGSLRFLESPAMPPAKFVRFDPDMERTDELRSKTLLELLCGQQNAGLTGPKQKQGAPKKSFNWKLPPPCAMLSLAGGLCAEDEGVEFRIDEAKALVLRRGLAEAVDRTKAWILTDGNRRTLSTRLAGRAVHYHLLEFESNDPPVCIGFCEYDQISQDVACKNDFSRSESNGMLHRYGAEEEAEGSDKRTVLDPFHTHFLMSDRVAAAAGESSHGQVTFTQDANGQSDAGTDGDGPQDASSVRSALEKYLSSNDVSGDGIQTPKVVLVIAGGLSTFREVRNALDPTDASTGTSVPVLIVTNSGYAAQDIAYYCATGKLPWEEGSAMRLDQNHEWRKPAYKKEAERFLPEILALGKQTGLNTTKQLSFCTVGAEVSDDAGTGVEGRRLDFATALQQALLNDCPNAVEEALLTIQWANHTILQEQLTNEKAMVEIQNKTNTSLSLDMLTSSGVTHEAVLNKLKGCFDSKNRFNLSHIEVTEPLYKMLTQPSVLQLGLTSGSNEVSKILLSYFESPMAVRLDELFETRHNRYPLRQHLDLWKAKNELVKQLVMRLLEEGGGTYMGKTRREHSFRRRADRKPSRGEKSGGGAAAVGNALGSTLGVAGEVGGMLTGFVGEAGGLFTSMAGNESARQSSPSHRVLSNMITGYKMHVNVRLLPLEGWRFPSPELGPTSTHTTWQDIMMWAVLSGNHSLAELVWPRTNRPMLAALQASQLCTRLAREDEVRPDKRELLEKAEHYEELATQTLGCVRSSAVAYALLSAIPWELAEKRRSHGEVTAEGEKRIALLWASSVLEEASTSDGVLSFPCRKFIGHRHTQETLGRYFAGNYPDSMAQTPPTGSLLATLMQCFVPFLPGTFVEVSPVSLKNKSSVLSGPKVNEMFNDDSEETRSVGADEQQALQEIREALEQGDAEVRDKEQAIKEGGMFAFLDEEVSDIWDDLKSFRFLAFYNIPKVKFVLDFFFYIVYVVQNTFIAINLRRVDVDCVNVVKAPCTNEDAGYTIVAPISINEYIFWGWCITKLLNEVDNIHSWDRTGLSEYFGDSWNQQDVAFMLITFTIIPLRLWINGLPGPPMTDVDGTGMHTLEALSVDLYSLLLVLNYYRILRYLSYYKSVGVLVLVVNFMLVDVAVFATLLFLITVGFGFAFVTLLPTRVADSPGAEFFLGPHPVWDSWWGMFGDYDRHTIYRQIGNQMPTAVLAPTMLWIYEFFSVVLLMNLLVALMSDTYARVTAEGEVNWQYARAGLIREYLTQSPLPAPFNVLYYALYNIPMWFYRQYRQRTVGEEPLDAGFKYVPSLRALTALRRAEQDAVRKLLEQREEEQGHEAATMIEAMTAKIDKIGRDNTMKFEAMNQRFDQLMQQVANVEDKKLASDDMKWAAPLDKVWHAPPAFTKADVGKTIKFEPMTWAIMRHLWRNEIKSRGSDVKDSSDDVDASLEIRWDEAYGCHVALSLVTLSNSNGTEVEQRLVCWQGEWSKDGSGGTFAKIHDPSLDREDDVIKRDITGSEPLVILSVEEDAHGDAVVMKTVTVGSRSYTPITSGRDRLTIEIDNPELFPHNEAMKKLIPIQVRSSNRTDLLGPSETLPRLPRAPVLREASAGPAHADVDRSIVV